MIFKGDLLWIVVYLPKLVSALHLLLLLIPQPLHRLDCRLNRSKCSMAFRPAALVIFAHAALQTNLVALAIPKMLA